MAPKRIRNEGEVPIKEKAGIGKDRLRKSPKERIQGALVSRDSVWKRRMRWAVSRRWGDTNRAALPTSLPPGGLADPRGGWKIGSGWHSSIPEEETLVETSVGLV